MGNGSEFITMAQTANAVAQHLDLQSASFQTLPRGSQRVLRRRDGHITVLIDPHRPGPDVAVDIADALVAANRLDGLPAARVKATLLHELARECLGEPDFSTSDIEHLTRSYVAAAASDDPRTQTGAVLVAVDGRSIEACNHLVPVISHNTDWWESSKKPDYVVHAETAVILAAARVGISSMDATLYTPWPACLACARDIIDAGIQRVVGHHLFRRAAAQATPSWAPDVDKALKLLDQAGVRCDWYPRPLVGVPPLRLGGEPFNGGEEPPAF